MSARAQGRLAPVGPIRPHRSVKPVKPVSPRGCLGVIAAAWLVWVLVDLVRLGVFSGDTTLGNAVFEAPSLGTPLFIGLVAGLVAVHQWWGNRRKKMFPGEPWMWERGWDRSGAKPQAARGIRTRLAVAFYASVGAAIVTFAVEMVADGRVPRWVSAPFWAAALAGWAWLGAAVAPSLKYGRRFFRYDTFPFFVGRRVSGSLEGLDRLQGFDEITVTLRCIRERRQVSGSGRRIMSETIHEEVKHCPPGEIRERPVDIPGQSGLAGQVFRKVLPVSFAVPEGKEGTRLDEWPAIRWEMQVAARVPGMDLDVTFLLPVYKPPSGPVQKA